MNRTKKIILMLVVWVPFLLSTSADASEQKSYNSNSGVGFYGEYIKPDKDSDGNNDKNNSDTPNKLVPQPSNTNGETIVNGGSLSRLPQTGENESSYLMVVGVYLVITILLFYFKKRKHRRNLSMKNIVKYGTTTAMILATLAGTGMQAFAADDYVRTYQSGGIVEFVPDETTTPPVDPENPDPEKPVEPWDPTNPEHKPEPGTNGPLSIDFASSLDFGKNKITNKDETYFANPQYFWNKDNSDFDPSSARPNYVQITDKRGTNGGWTLTVKQEGQFKNETTLNKELSGSQIKFTEGTPVSNMEKVLSPKTSDMELTPNVAATVMTAAKGAGAGTWVDRFGKLEDMEIEGETVKKNKAISLDVPGTTAKDAVKYETKLTWTLTDVPGNA